MTKIGPVIARARWVTLDGLVRLIGGDVPFRD